MWYAVDRLQPVRQDKADLVLPDLNCAAGASADRTSKALAVLSLAVHRLAVRCATSHLTCRNVASRLAAFRRGACGLLLRSNVLLHLSSSVVLIRLERRLVHQDSCDALHRGVQAAIRRGDQFL
jgi:hypothetical protein